MAKPGNRELGPEQRPSPSCLLQPAVSHPKASISSPSCATSLRPSIQAHEPARTLYIQPPAQPFPNVTLASVLPSQQAWSAALNHVLVHLRFWCDHPPRSYSTSTVAFLKCTKKVIQWKHSLWKCARSRKAKELFTQGKQPRQENQTQNIRSWIGTCAAKKCYWGNW